ncbi:putative acetyltransferase [mine drainage metagenome]|uniref:Putative acetyltransferase n=1 Tax=mine drainage metagenome TaxID=410659 RepID=A0A1J5RK80_9ZZZZ
MNAERKVYQDLSRFRVPSGFRGRSAVVVQLWWLIQASLFAWSPQFLYGWRRWLLRCFGARVGEGVLIRPSARVTYPWKLILGDRAWIGDEVVLYSLGSIRVGADAVVSQRCYLCAGTHDYSTPGFDILALPIVVGDQAWVASDVFVAPGVAIGRGAVVGARSNVFADLPEGMICVGSPCRPVKSRLE